MSASLETAASKWHVAVACDISLGQFMWGNPETQGKYIDIDPAAVTESLEVIYPEPLKEKSLLFIASTFDSYYRQDIPETQTKIPSASDNRIAKANYRATKCEVPIGMINSVYSLLPDKLKEVVHDEFSDQVILDNPEIIEDKEQLSEIRDDIQKVFESTSGHPLYTLEPPERIQEACFKSLIKSAIMSPTPSEERILSMQSKARKRLTLPFLVGITAVYAGSEKALETLNAPSLLAHSASLLGALAVTKISSNILVSLLSLRYIRREIKRLREDMHNIDNLNEDASEIAMLLPTIISFKPLFTSNTDQLES